MADGGGAARESVPRRVAWMLLAGPTVPTLAPMKGRGGFSLVECVVALVLCAGGLMAVSGATRALLDLAALGHRTAGAAEIASARLATLHAAACGADAAGEATWGAYHEAWSVAGAGAGRRASVAVTFSVGGKARTVHYEAVLACPT